MSTSFACWEAQNWTQASRWCLTSADKRGRATCLSLLATLSLMQPRYCWPPLPRGRTAASSSACPLGHPCPFLHSCFPDGLPQPAPVHGAFLQRCRTLHFLRFFFFFKVPPAHFFSLLRPLWMAMQLSGVHSSKFFIIFKLAECTLAPSIQIISEEESQLVLLKIP